MCKIMDRRYRKRMARYWNQMEGRATRAIADVADSDWFDHWHVHPDWKGRAERADNRPASVALAIKLLKAAEVVASLRGDPVQAWLAIGPSAKEDAVYLHSSNGNGTPFPFAFDNVEWEVEVPSWLSLGNDERKTHTLGKASYEEGPVWILIRREFLPPI